MKHGESLHWTSRSLDFAFECGATAVSLIPTRAGNGAVDHLALLGDFELPEFSIVESALDYGLHLKQGRVFVDLWEVDHVFGSSCCRKQRLQRISDMNLSQSILERVCCEDCDQPHAE